MLQWPATSHWNMLVAFRLSTACTSKLPPDAGTSGGLLPVTGMGQWPLNLLLACAGSLLPVACTQPLTSACHKRAPVAFHLSLAHAGDLLPVSGTCQWPHVCHHHVSEICCLSPACSGVVLPVHVLQACRPAGLPPIASTGHCVSPVIGAIQWISSYRLPPVTRVHWWCATSCRRVLVACHLSLECLSCLLPIARVCQRTSTCRRLMLVVFCQMQGHAGGLSLVTSVHL